MRRPVTVYFWMYQSTIATSSMRKKGTSIPATALVAMLAKEPLSWGPLIDWSPSIVAMVAKSAPVASVPMNESIRALTTTSPLNRPIATPASRVMHDGRHDAPGLVDQ